MRLLSSLQWALISTITRRFSCCYMPGTTPCFLRKVGAADPRGGGPVTTYDLWFHESLDWFAVRLDAGLVTGICGPLC